MSAKTIQVPSQAPLKYLVALIAKETKSRGPIDLLSGFPPRSLSLKVTSEKAPISNFLRTNEMITIASKASSSSSKKKTPIEVSTSTIGPAISRVDVGI